ncbi:MULTISPECIES: hypothetical protein [unclassified Mesorhizobium]|uniref:hypothetical protein n=1 Tax=unclassified Mesorhizobium TaxID=325217 RepID=UPI000FC9A5F0|nr:MULTISPECIES: hypothetical protein [unclassified Mesorhizobium]RUT85550.1 hypothetical protein EOD14_16990 [Mesorhizobium sp. M7A.T.Ca.US.000.02.1.1]RUT91368.1 hypothetical protein EOD15_15025 [Mesorhizobium sp. M7A.T.Ca.US.000.02.2.1]RUU05912.1 hypothetical protein EOD12_01655 [Mesorhizobium sp. M7A.T.Ca.TU.009.02.1.1]
MDVINKNIPLNSYTVSIGNIRKIYRGLQRLVDEEADLEIARWAPLTDQTQEEFEARKTQVRKLAFRVTITVNRENGSSTYGDTEDIFDLSGHDSFVASIFMTNKTAFRREANTDPVNWFELLFDFSQPALMDANSIVSSPTRNASGFQINGSREGWLAGIERLVLNQIDKKHKLRRFFHGPFVYDYGLIFFGMPLAIYTCWILVPFVNGVISSQSNILGNGTYVYIVLASLWFYRVLFGYTKWAFPLVEMKEQQKRPKLHRRFWWGLVILLSGKIFWDFFDPYISIGRWFAAP